MCGGRSGGKDAQGGGLVYLKTVGGGVETFKVGGGASHILSDSLLLGLPLAGLGPLPR